MALSLILFYFARFSQGMLSPNLYQKNPDQDGAYLDSNPSFFWIRPSGLSIVFWKSTLGSVQRVSSRPSSRIGVG